MVPQDQAAEVVLGCEPPMVQASHLESYNITLLWNPGVSIIRLTAQDGDVANCLLKLPVSACVPALLSTES